MANLFRLLLMATITVSTLAACSLWEERKPLLNNSLENTPLPSVPNVNPKTIAPENLPDAPYLQSPRQVVIKMLEIAKVKPNDVVYDLGSGDGRIVITAAQKFGAKAIGIEIDPELIRESDRATKAALEETPQIRNQIKFVKQDLFKTDLRDATVITLYLSEKANLRVRSEILPKLRSGTRIVSYQYTLGDLPPTLTEKIKVGDQEHMIYLWILD
ncbi:SAM-dependent methyltransferase [Pseudanabaena sp. ABRG5-3]|uniref:SAM-dependent methyltransferase n=1 Tax=Pseudanabaena sp. ABRG5-3 TaxID=685565 RepID=UPI000DC710C9|nr:class I SAM-dependent methyltransferase [Pseudanabaena sp. ABRG5-3]BBC25232.1 RNA methylase [Pseudanabaena sp. ABRG5-3]